MKISKTVPVREDWDQTKSWNYKLPSLRPYQSLVYAEVIGEHSEVTSNDLERIYYIVEGSGKFVIGSDTTLVSKGDVFTIPPHTVYNYFADEGATLKIVLLMELWDN